MFAVLSRHRRGPPRAPLSSLPIVLSSPISLQADRGRNIYTFTSASSADHARTAASAPSSPEHDDSDKGHSHQGDQRNAPRNLTEICTCGHSSPPLFD